jgi:hypothetical protein
MESGKHKVECWRRVLKSYFGKLILIINSWITSNISTYYLLPTHVFFFVFLPDISRPLDLFAKPYFPLLSFYRPHIYHQYSLSV